MGESSWDKREARLRMPSLMGVAVQAGISCPWNQDDAGPAKRKLQCLIWRDWDEYMRYREDSARFCRSTCHYGHNFAQQRGMVERAKAAFLAEKAQLESFQRRIGATREWWQRGDWMRSLGRL